MSTVTSVVHWSKASYAPPPPLPSLEDENVTPKELLSSVNRRSHRDVKQVADAIYRRTTWSEADGSLSQIAMPSRFQAMISCVDLSGNHLSELPVEFSKLKGITFLNLSHNQFEVYPHAITSLPNLKILNLSHNKLKAIDPAIGTQLQLVTLDFSYNPDLHHMSIAVGHLSSLFVCNFSETEVDFDMLESMNNLINARIKGDKCLKWRIYPWSIAAGKQFTPATLHRLLPPEMNALKEWLDTIAMQDDCCEKQKELAQAVWEHIQLVMISLADRTETSQLLGLPSAIV